MQRCQGPALNSRCGLAPDADVEKNVTVAVTTDKGLCGGINSTVCRYVRGMSHMYTAGAQLLGQQVLQRSSELQ